MNNNNMIYDMIGQIMNNNNMINDMIGRIMIDNFNPTSQHDPNSTCDHTLPPLTFNLRFLWVPYPERLYLLETYCKIFQQPVNNHNC